MNMRSIVLLAGSLAIAPACSSKSSEASEGSASLFTRPVDARPAPPPPLVPDAHGIAVRSRGGGAVTIVDTVGGRQFDFWGQPDLTPTTTDKDGEVQEVFDDELDEAGVEYTFAVTRLPHGHYDASDLRATYDRLV